MPLRPKRVLPKSLEVKALEKIQQEIWFASYDARELEGTQSDLMMSIEDLAEKVDTLSDIVEGLTTVTTKLLQKLEEKEESNAIKT